MKGSSRDSVTKKELLTPFRGSGLLNALKEAVSKKRCFPWGCTASNTLRVKPSSPHSSHTGELLPLVLSGLAACPSPRTQSLLQAMVWYFPYSPALYHTKLKLSTSQASYPLQSSLHCICDRETVEYSCNAGIISSYDTDTGFPIVTQVVWEFSIICLSRFFCERYPKSPLSLNDVTEEQDIIAIPQRHQNSCLTQHT